MPDSHALVAVVFERPASLQRAHGAVPADILDRRVTEMHDAAVDEAQEIAEAGATLARGLGLDAVVEVIESSSGVPAALSEAADRNSCDVVVCGTRGRGGLSRALLGSTSTGLLHQANVPVMIAPEDPGDLGGPVMVAYDGSLWRFWDPWPRPSRTTPSGPP